MASSDVRKGMPARRLTREVFERRFQSAFIDPAFSHEELSEMVRPRISAFMLRFRCLGLIETTREHFLVSGGKELTDYPAQIARRGYVPPSAAQ